MENHSPGSKRTKGAETLNPREELLKLALLESRRATPLFSNGASIQTDGTGPIFTTMKNSCQESNFSKTIIFLESHSNIFEDSSLNVFFRRKKGKGVGAGRSERIWGNGGGAPSNPLPSPPTLRLPQAKWFRFFLSLVSDCRYFQSGPLKW